MWGEYVVGFEETLSLLACIYVIVQYPPHLHEAYNALYIYRTVPNFSRRLFYAFSFSFFLFVQICDVVKTHGHCFAFYTTWNYMLQIFYWGWSLVDRNGKNIKRHVLFDVIFPSSLLVVIVVWGILYPLALAIHEEAILLNWISYSQHGINAIFLSIEWYWNDIRHIGSTTCALAVIFPTIYVIFAWIIHAASQRDFWPYPFLATDRPLAPIWYFILLLVQIVMFSFVRLIAFLRVRNINRVPNESMASLLDTI